MAPPPHPGAQPQPIRFPFGPARDALTAMDDLLRDLKDCREAHHDAVVGLRDGFEGRTRDQFDTAFNDAMRTLDNHIWTLGRERNALEDHIAEADRKVHARQNQIHTWQQAMNAYQAAHPVPTGAR